MITAHIAAFAATLLFLLPSRMPLRHHNVMLRYVDFSSAPAYYACCAFFIACFSALLLPRHAFFSPLR